MDKQLDGALKARVKTRYPSKCASRLPNHTFHNPFFLSPLNEHVRKINVKSVLKEQTNTWIK